MPPYQARMFEGPVVLRVAGDGHMYGIHWLSVLDVRCSLRIPAVSMWDAHALLFSSFSRPSQPKPSIPALEPGPVPAYLVGEGYEGLEVVRMEKAESEKPAKRGITRDCTRLSF